jgi:hypothetical protein
MQMSRNRARAQSPLTQCQPASWGGVIDLRVEIKGFRIAMRMFFSILLPILRFQFLLLVVLLLGD